MTPNEVRVVVTGLGCVSPVGNTAPETWEGLLAGRSGVSRLRAFDVNGSQPGYAAEVKDLSPERAGLPRRKLKMMGRQAQLAFAAVQEACTDAGLASDAAAVDRERLGIILGVGMLNADVEDLGRAFHTMQAATGPAFVQSAFNRAAARELLPLWLLRHIPNLAAAHAGIALDAQGPSNTITTGCVAGASAIGEAARIVARGEADVVIAGGTDARVSPLAMLRYRELGWLSTRTDCDPEDVSAPFDACASGFVNGEGAAVLVLEAEPHARRRGARIRAELMKYAAANDANGLFVHDRNGRALRTSVDRCAAALRDAGAPVDCVFAPASGVRPLDSAAAAALSGVVGLDGPIAATRSLLGHTHAASAAVDAVAAVQALGGRRIPAVRNLTRPIASLAFARGGDLPRVVESAIVGAYGFGGHGAALAFRRWRE